MFIFNARLLKFFLLATTFTQTNILNSIISSLLLSQTYRYIIRVVLLNWFWINFLSLCIQELFNFSTISAQPHKFSYTTSYGIALKCFDLIHVFIQRVTYYNLLYIDIHIYMHVYVHTYVIKNAYGLKNYRNNYIYTYI